MPKTRTFEEFKDVFYNKFPNSKIEILEFSEKVNTNNTNCYVIIKDNYGICEVSIYNLVLNKKPSIQSAINKEEYLTNQIRERFPENLEKYKIVKYIDNKNVTIKNKYGFCKIIASNLLKGYCPTIKCALNKTSYLTNIIKEKFPNNLDKYKILEYTCQTNVLVETRYGLCKGNSDHLLLGKMPCIISAINKTEYFINQAKEIHGDKYDYSLVDYVKNSIPIKVICPIHKEFITKGVTILRGSGCSKCGDKICSDYHSENPTGWGKNDWWKTAQKSKEFTGFKIYIIKCWNENEQFYKIGRTFLNINKRFSKSKIPYNYKIIKIINFKHLTEENCNLCYNLENIMKKENKEHKYIPKIVFDGYKECYKKYKI